MFIPAISHPQTLAVGSGEFHMTRGGGEQEALKVCPPLVYRGQAYDVLNPVPALAGRANLNLTTRGLAVSCHRRHLICPLAHRL